MYLVGRFVRSSLCATAAAATAATSCCCCSYCSRTSDTGGSCSYLNKYPTEYPPAISSLLLERTHCSLAPVHSMAVQSFWRGLGSPSDLDHHGTPGMRGIAGQRQIDAGEPPLYNIPLVQASMYWQARTCLFKLHLVTFVRKRPEFTRRLVWRDRS